MNLALFDFDGTITRTDTWTAFLHFAVNPRRIAAGKGILIPVMIGYKLGVISAGTARELASGVALRGQSETVIRRKASAYAAEILPGVVRGHALERIQWHQQQGDRIVVVSASLDVYLEAWCRPLGVDLICTELDVRNGVLTGRYREGDCSGEEKARRIRARFNLDEFPVVYAYGDTEEDREMLDLADRKWFRWREVSPGRPRAAADDSGSTPETHLD